MYELGVGSDLIHLLLTALSAEGRLQKRSLFFSEGVSIQRSTSGQLGIQLSGGAHPPPPSVQSGGFPQGLCYLQTQSNNSVSFLIKEPSVQFSGGPAILSLNAMLTTLIRPRVWKGF